MNIIDSIYEQIAPIKAVERKRARIQLETIRSLKNSGYDEGGASHRKNSMKGWIASSKSPQKDIDLNLNTLRQRSRSLCMTAPLAKSAINTERTNVIGSGLILKPRVDYETLGISKEEGIKLENQINKEWKLWSESVFCDNSKLNNFYEMQQIAFISELMNGDAFAFPIYKDTTPVMPYSLRIKLIEGDKVSTPNSCGDHVNLAVKDEKTKNRIWNGVEIDETGEVVAYHVCNGYPEDYETIKKWVRVEAYGEITGNPNVLHIFEAERCEQYRGVPFLAPVIEPLKQLTRYTDAELMAAVINGLFTVFIKTEDGTDDVDFNGTDENELNIDEANDASYELGNGLVQYLKTGESVEIADSKRPGTNFDGFVSSMCKYIGAALEIPYEVLTKQYSASYSASRAALLEAFKAFKRVRVGFANDFCTPVYKLWLSEAVAIGRIKAPGYFNDPAIQKAYAGALWTGPSPGQLDPVKDANGAVLRIANGFSTYAKESAEINGTDFFDNAEQLLEENKIMNEIKKIRNELEEGQ